MTQGYQGDWKARSTEFVEGACLFGGVDEGEGTFEGGRSEGVEGWLKGVFEEV